MYTGGKVGSGGLGGTCGEREVKQTKTNEAKTDARDRDTGEGSRVESMMQTR